MKRSSQQPIGNTQELLDELNERGAKANPGEVAAADERLDELLTKVDLTETELSTRASVDTTQVESVPLQAWPEIQTRTATPVGIDGRNVTLNVRGSTKPIHATLAEDVDTQLIARAIESGDRVVIEREANGASFIVGVLQTRVPDEIHLEAKRIHLDANEEILLRSGRGAMRIRRDGDVELVGSRISAMSRGLFRLVGRVLRLN
jgi:hypothetical protein